MRRKDIWSRLVAGTVAGVAGTAVILALQEAGQKMAPDMMPPMRQHPGEFMVKQVEEVAPVLGDKVPQTVDKVTAQVLGIGYGVTFAWLYAALRKKVRSRQLYSDAGILGLSCWATGYLGWLPATKLMPPVWKQKPMQVVGAIASHVAYGLTTVAAYRELRRR